MVKIVLAPISKHLLALLLIKQHLEIRMTIKRQMSKLEKTLLQVLVGTGQWSVAELARMYDITEQGVRVHIKRGEWYSAATPENPLSPVQEMILKWGESVHINRLANAPIEKPSAMPVVPRSEEEVLVTQIAQHLVFIESLMQRNADADSITRARLALKPLYERLDKVRARDANGTTNNVMVLPATPEGNDWEQLASVSQAYTKEQASNDELTAKRPPSSLNELADMMRLQHNIILDLHTRLVEAQAADEEVEELLRDASQLAPWDYGYEPEAPTKINEADIDHDGLYERDNVVTTKGSDNETEIEAEDNESEQAQTSDLSVPGSTQAQPEASTGWINQARLLECLNKYDKQD